MFEKLKEKLNFEIISIQFVERNGLKYLDIELPDSELKIIEEKSEKISNALDELDFFEDNYYLNIFSSGTEKEIKLENINLFLDKNIFVKLSKHYLGNNCWEGTLIECNLNQIVMKVNNKGRMQKLNINRADINFIKTTAKLRKEK